MPIEQTDTMQLAAQARIAYEQKHLRECLTLTKALAHADPGNAEAHALEAAIRADIQQDLHDARALLEQSGVREEMKKYRKAAEIILIKVLHLDPDNEEAKVLLQSARGVPVLAPRPSADIPFTAAPGFVQKKEQKRGRIKLPFVLVAIVIVAGGLLLTLYSRQTNPKALAGPVTKPAPSSQPDFQSPDDPQQSPVPAPSEPAPGVDLQQPSAPNQQPVSTAAPGAVPPPINPPAPAIPSANASPGLGRLAVSSIAAAEIYMGDQYLGSTPATLRLPAGRQTLEYRHGDLRTVVSHNIKPNETATASITFQLNVQINAKPWAQVFLDGASRRPLGQTPLSGVTVPIGGILVFEHPNFTPKRRRITDVDSAIQVDFP
jgi:hypothetical protein